jgi:hypothetical protein
VIIGLNDVLANGDFMGTTEVTWADAVQAIASVVGFGIVIYQVWQLKRTVQSDTHSKLYAHYLEVNKLLLQNSYLRPYFYESKILDESDLNHPNIRRDVDMMCEVVLGLLEHAVLQKPNLPDDSWKNCWMAYVYERYQKSPELARFFSGNRELYAKCLQDVLGDRLTASS